MAEELVLRAIKTAWLRRRSLNIRRGVTPDLLLRLDVPYSRRSLYRICDTLASAGKLQKLHYGGYVPIGTFS